MTINFDDGKIETCTCCGKDLKRPVKIARLGGRHFGKRCRDDIVHASQLIWMLGEEQAVESLKRDWPREWEKLMHWALQYRAGKAA